MAKKHLHWHPHVGQSAPPLAKYVLNRTHGPINSQFSIFLALYVGPRHPGRPRDGDTHRPGGVQARQLAPGIALAQDISRLLKQSRQPQDKLPRRSLPPYVVSVTLII